MTVWCRHRPFLAPWIEFWQFVDRRIIVSRFLRLCIVQTHQSAHQQLRWRIVYPFELGIQNSEQSLLKLPRTSVLWWCLHLDQGLYLVVFQVMSSPLGNRASRQSFSEFHESNSSTIYVIDVRIVECHNNSMNEWLKSDKEWRNSEWWDSPNKTDWMLLSAHAPPDNKVPMKLKNTRKNCGGLEKWKPPKGSPAEWLRK